jgi:hypothetical protein
MPVRDLRKIHHKQIRAPSDSPNAPIEHVIQPHQNNGINFTNDYVNGSAYQGFDNNVDGRDDKNRTLNYRFQSERYFATKFQVI